MKRLNVLLLVVSMLFHAGNAMGAVTNNQQASADAETYEYLKSRQGIAFSETPNDGQSSTASLSFNYVYRDFSAENGAPVIVSGSLNAYYQKGKSLYYSLKVVPSVVHTETSETKPVYPDYLDVLINGQSINGCKDLDMKTANGGRLVGFSDKELTVTHKLNESGTLDIVIRYSLDNGSHFNDLSLFSLIPANDKSLTKGKFRTRVLQMEEMLRN